MQQLEQQWENVRNAEHFHYENAIHAYCLNCRAEVGGSDTLEISDADKLLVHLNDCALSASPGSGSLEDQMIARAEYDAIQNCMKAVESQPTAYDTDEIVRRLDDTSFLVATSKAFWDDPQNGKYVENVVRLSNAIKIVKESE